MVVAKLTVSLLLSLDDWLPLPILLFPQVCYLSGNGLW